jgi:hypothetical protein
MLEIVITAPERIGMLHGAPPPNGYISRAAGPSRSTSMTPTAAPPRTFMPMYRAALPFTYG